MPGRRVVCNGNGGMSPIRSLGNQRCWRVHRIHFTNLRMGVELNPLSLGCVNPIFSDRLLRSDHSVRHQKPLVGKTVFFHMSFDENRFSLFQFSAFGFECILFHESFHCDGASIIRHIQLDQCLPGLDFLFLLKDNLTADNDIPLHVLDISKWPWLALKRPPDNHGIQGLLLFLIDLQRRAA